MAKRKNNEGTWGQRTINGNKYYYYRDANKKFTYGKTVNEVKQKIAEKKSKSYIKKSNANTIQEYAYIWLENTKKNVLKQQTYDGYETLISTWNSGSYYFGNVLLKEITDRHVQKWIDSMVNDKYTVGTIKKQWSILKQTLVYGMAKKEINQFELSLISLPTEERIKKKTRKVAFATVEDVEELYKEAYRKKESNKGLANSEYTYGNNARAIVLIAYTGLRVGELTALQWRDVDLNNNIITIRHTHATIKDRSINNKKYDIILSTPKTHEIRTVPLSKRAIEQIDFFEKCNPNHTDDDYVCISRNKTHLTKRNMDTTLKRMLERCDANSSLTLHSLRHGFGSILLERGVDIKIISEILGHADIRTTYNIYIGITDKQKLDAIKVLD